MKKSDILSHIVKETNITKAEAEEAMIAFLEAVKEGLKNGGKVTLTGFGSFSVVERKARMGRNPKTGEPVEIPESKTVKFTPAKALKEEVNV